MKKPVAMADLRSIMVALHNSNGPVSTAASVHFDPCTPNIKVQECFDDFSESWVVEAVPGTPRPQDGNFHLPEGPGPGISLNEDIIIKERPFKEGFFNMFEVDSHMRQFKKTEGN